MPSQDEMLKGIALPVRTESLEEGDLKARNKPGEVQRPLVTDRDRKNYKMSVKLVTCVHGYMTKEKTTPASLMVFEYQLDCLEDFHDFTSVKTTLDFLPKSADTKLKIHAYAPLSKKWNKSSGINKSAWTTSANIVVPTPVVTPNVGLNHTWESTYDLELCTSLISGRSKGDTQAYWKFRENPGKRDGIQSPFYVAVLICLSRKERFNCNFCLKIRGCAHFGFSQKLDRFLRRADTIDDPIVFDPEMTPSGLVPPGVDVNSLGSLCSGKELKLPPSSINLDPASLDLPVMTSEEHGEGVRQEAA
jgi:hypothetical protein